MKVSGMSGKSKSRSSQLRLIRVYLFSVLLLTFFLFSASVVSFVQQEEIADDLATLDSRYNQTAQSELIFLGISAGMFLSIFALGIYLLICVSRDLHWLEVRSDFVEGVSHELKTPLSMILLYSETLADGMEDFTLEERMSYLRIIARESARLSRLINNVLNFSQIEQGKKKYRLTENDLVPTVMQTVQDYSEFLARRGFDVKLGIQPSLPPVRFNREEVTQAILNLLDNAWKYSGSSRLIRVHMWREANEVVLEIVDYGRGIPIQEQKKICQPFYRAEKGGETGGCGLGLFLVSEVMAGHGGRIDLISKTNEGTRFRLFFPISSSADEMSEEPRKPDFLRASY